MTYNFTVTPDFNPDLISAWFIFNTWLQKHWGEHIHLELYNDFPQLQQALETGQVDLIYANPYETTALVRERGFVPLVRPLDKQDEGVIVTRDDHPAQRVEDLRPGIRVATTQDPDVNRICLIMLEPAELDTGNIQLVYRNNHLLAAKDVFRGEADVAFILAEAYDAFSTMLQSRLRPLVRSQIRDIHHTLLAGPRLADRQEDLQSLLINMHHTDKGPGVLESLGFSAWEQVAGEDVEFMIDLMDTLES